MRRIVIAALMFTATLAPAMAEGDAARGEKAFMKCKTCHDIEKGVNRIGPTMKGIIGRPVASIADFKYSEAMLAKGKEGAVWDEPTLTAYTVDPKAVVPKTKMIFGGLKKPEEVADLIAFLKTKP